MATAEEILEKARGKKRLITAFKPKSHRAWDFVFENNKQVFENATKNENKIGTKPEQYRNKDRTKEKQNRNKTGTKPEQNNNKNGNKNGNKNSLIENQQFNHLYNEKEDQNQHNNTFEPETEVLCVMNGIQNKIMRQVISHIKNQPNKNYSVDIPISILAKKINASKESVRVSIKRLRKKKVLIRLVGEKGRYGNTKISVPENVVKKYFELFNDPPCNIDECDKAKWEQNGNVNRNINWNNQNSSSSYKNILKTTTTGESENQIFAEWQNIDVEPLSGINFTTNHLHQIASQNKLSPEIVQESIYAFAFDLQENNKAAKIKGDPINFFMGILRNGKPYAPPSNYESPQDKAMRIYLENIRATEQRRVDMEKEAITLAFNSWFSKLSNEQKIEFLPEMLRHNVTSEKLGKSKQLEVSAKSYFEREIWPDEKAKIVANT